MKIQGKFGYGGWENCIFMTNGKVELVVTTDIGPRIIRFGFTGGQNLFREFKEQLGKTGGDRWRIYGGHRLWHAPEASPRSYFPDNSPVKYEIYKRENKVKLTQDTEKATGMQKEIEIKLDSEKNNVTIIHRITNRTLWDIEISPWALSVMNLKGRAIVPQEPYKSWEEKLTPARPIVLWAYTNMGDPRWVWGKKYIQLKQDPNAKTRQKLGILNTTGWAAYYLNGELFIKKYKYDPKAIYTDFGVNTEIYTDSDILEVETLGEYKKIPPQGSAEHTESWWLFKAKIDEREESIDGIVLPLVKETNETTKL